MCKNASRTAVKSTYLSYPVPVPAGRVLFEYSCTRFWQLRAARAARGAPAGGSTGVAGAHKFTEGDYFLFPFRRVSCLRRPFVLRPACLTCFPSRQSQPCSMVAVVGG